MKAIKGAEGGAAVDGPDGLSGTVETEDPDQEEPTLKHKSTSVSESLWNWVTGSRDSSTSSARGMARERSSESPYGIWTSRTGHVPLSEIDVKHHDVSVHDANTRASISRSSSVAVSMWNWANGHASVPHSREASAHGGNAYAAHQSEVGAALWNWGNGRNSPQDSDDSVHGSGAYAKSDGHLTRNASLQDFMWSWKGANPLPSRDNSAHGGNVYHQSKGIMRISSESAALWNWKNGRVSYPESAHSSIASTPRGSPSISRNASKLWFWQSGSPPASTDTSLKDGSAYHAAKSNLSNRASISASLWDWSNGRVNLPPSEPTSPRSSTSPRVERQGTNHSPPTVRFSSSHGGIPRNSSHSAIWSWGQGRPTPPASRDNSLRGGNIYERFAHLRLSVPSPDKNTDTNNCASPLKSHPPEK